MIDYYGFWPLMCMSLVACIPGGIVYYLTKKITKKEILPEIVGAIVGSAVFILLVVFCKK